jgi:hypothetical protein
LLLDLLQLRCCSLGASQLNKYQPINHGLCTLIKLYAIRFGMVGLRSVGQTCQVLRYGDSQKRRYLIDDIYGVAMVRKELRSCMTYPQSCMPAF